MAQKWNWKTHQYEPYTLPLNATMFSFDLEQMVACAGCGSYLKYRETFTSLEIHDSIGLGYVVCEKCHNEEWERRGSTNNAE